ncbi:MAG: type II toxin-antitoxin system VapB family antitoxin [Parvularculaceae bacterium]
MALFIRDEKVDALASELQKALKAPSKKEAVRIALERELERSVRTRPRRRFDFRKSRAMAKAMGASDSKLDMKKFMDEMWGDL